MVHLCASCQLRLHENTNNFQVSVKLKEAKIREDKRREEKRIEEKRRGEVATLERQPES